MSELKEILNFVQLTPEIGTAGQPTPDQFADIRAAGYETVVNLALPTSDNAVADEGGLVTGLGMSYFHMPVDFDAPTADEAKRFIGVMQAHEGRRVFVHCAMNLRVSAFMYLYLKHACGVSEEESRSPVLDRWDPKMSDVWREFLQLSKEDVLG